MSLRITKTQRLLRRFPDCGHSGSHSYIWSESPCYLSMSHTGLPTRLSFLHLCNSTARVFSLLSFPVWSSRVEKQGVLLGVNQAAQSRLSLSVDAVCVRCALCGARLLNGYKQEALQWIHYVKRPITGTVAAVALETGAGWNGPVLMNC